MACRTGRAALDYFGKKNFTRRPVHSISKLIKSDNIPACGEITASFLLPYFKFFFFNTRFCIYVIRLVAQITTEVKQNPTEFCRRYVKREIYDKYLKLTILKIIRYNLWKHNLNVSFFFHQNSSRLIVFFIKFYFFIKIDFVGKYNIIKNRVMYQK